MNKTTNIFVTGGLGSLGYQVVRELSNSGEHRIYSIDSKMQKNNREVGDNVRYLKCDLNCYSSTNRLFTERKIKPVDNNVLINFAGLIYNEPIIRLEDGKLKAHSELGWRKCVGGNIDTAFNTTVHFIKYLFENRKKGVVINASSITTRGNPGQLAYTTAKAALSGFTNTIGKEMGPLGIRCVALELGYFDVESTNKSVPESKLKTIKANNPMGRLGSINDLVQAVNSIIENNYINATTIRLDGGQIQ